MQTHADRPAESLDSSAINLAIQQRATERALRRLARLRTKASAEIDRLLSFLDASDDYASTELEDQVDDGPVDEDELEPTLSATEAYGMKGERGMIGSCVDDADSDGNCDDEPSLGSPEVHPNPYHSANDYLCSQEHWASGARDDREYDEVEMLESDDLEDGEGDDNPDDEPSLGAPEGMMNQEQSWGIEGGDCSDREDPEHATTATDAKLFDAAKERYRPAEPLRYGNWREREVRKMLQDAGHKPVT